MLIDQKTQAQVENTLIISEEELWQLRGMWKMCETTWEAVKFGDVDQLTKAREVFDWDGGVGCFYDALRRTCMRETHLTTSAQMLYEFSDVVCHIQLVRLRMGLVQSATYLLQNGEPENSSRIKRHNILLKNMWESSVLRGILPDPDGSGFYDVSAGARFGYRDIMRLGRIISEGHLGGFKQDIKGRVKITLAPQLQ